MVLDFPFGKDHFVYIVLQKAVYTNACHKVSHPIAEKTTPCLLQDSHSGYTDPTDHQRE